MTFGGTPRPAARWYHSTTELDDFALISYRVDTERLRRRVPAAFDPDLFTFDDGTSGSLVSAVPFLDRDFCFRAVPQITLSCGQINYRAYGSLGGVRGVWFFGTSLDTPLVLAPRWLWRMPWHRDRIDVEASWAQPGPARWRLSATGPWGVADADLTVTDQAMGRLDGFADADDTAEVLTHPTTGWYRRRSSGASSIGEYTVWHDVMDLARAEVHHSRFKVFEDLDLVSPGAPVHSALVQRSVHFDVHTPPHRLG